jgi:hypothetical protein
VASGTEKKESKKELNPYQKALEKSNEKCSFKQLYLVGSYLQQR